MHNLFELTTADNEDSDEITHNVAFHQVYTVCLDKTIFREKKLQFLLEL